MYRYTNKMSCTRMRFSQLLRWNFVANVIRTIFKIPKETRFQWVPVNDFHLKIVGFAKLFYTFIPSNGFSLSHFFFFYVSFSFMGICSFHKYSLPLLFLFFSFHSLAFVYCNWNLDSSVEKCIFISILIALQFKHSVLLSQNMRKKKKNLYNRS